MKISENFELKEFTESSTAKLKGISNNPGVQEVKAIENLVIKLLQPLRLVYGKRMVINSGYRCPELNAAVGGVPTSQHCFDMDTEILTDRGWATPNTIDECDHVYSYNIENGFIELVPIDNVIKRHHKGVMICIQSKHTDIMVTDQHRMLIRYDTNKYIRKGGFSMTPKAQKYFDSLKTENDKYHIELIGDIYGRRRRFLCAGMMEGSAEVDIPLLKMCMAAISDGYFCHKNRTVALGFRFKKIRKCQQLENLLHELDWYYTKKIDKNGIYNYYLRSSYAGQVYDIIGPNKIIPKWILNIGSDNLRELVQYYSFYDGSWDKRENCESFSIFSSIKENVDTIQAMCALSGMRSQYLKKDAGVYNIKGSTGPKKESYHVTINPNKFETKVKEDSFSIADYDGLVWCVNNRNTTLIVRRNGKISIQGNCKGEAADVACEHPSYLVECLRKSGLDFDQCIQYSTFVHLSLKLSGQNRKQYLKGKY
ncbi:D-Ala-D-Ala carboxypeptidase family metallohydrolase [Parabacteroides sp. APC149_11_2_Y6]